MTTQAVTYNFETQSYFPHATNFSICTRAGVDHAFIMDCFTNTFQNLQISENVPPATIEKLKDFLTSYIAHRDTTIGGERFNKLLGTRDVDIHAKALEMLLQKSETRSIAAMNAIVDKNPVSGDDLLSLGTKLVGISSRLATSDTVQKASHLFDQAFGAQIAGCDEEKLDAWTGLLVHMYPGLRWIPSLLRANPSDARISAIAFSMQRLQESSKDLSEQDLAIFAALHEAVPAHKTSRFQIAYRVFTVLQPSSSLQPRSWLKLFDTLSPDEATTLLVDFLKTYTKADDSRIKQAIAALMLIEDTAWLESLFYANRENEKSQKCLLDIFIALSSDDTTVKTMGSYDIYNRYRQISGSTTPLSSLDNFRIAIWIETKKPCLFQTIFYHKQSTHLACHIQYDFNGDLFLLFDEDTTALHVPDAHDCPVKLVVHHVAEGIVTQNIADLKMAPNVQQGFSGERGIWPLLSFCDVDASTLSIITEQATNTLETRWVHTDSLFFKLCEDVIYGLDALHSRGRLHGDIQPKNILYALISDSQLVGGFTHFDKSLLVDVDSKPRSCLLQGCYGTQKYTAPEFLALPETIPDFKGDLLKADIWALGCVLYEVYINHLESLMYIESEHQKKRQITNQDRKEVQELATMQIARVEMSLRFDKIPSLNTALQRWICTLVRPDPQMRPDSKKAMQDLASIKSLYRRKGELL